MTIAENAENDLGSAVDTTVAYAPVTSDVAQELAREAAERALSEADMDSGSDEVADDVDGEEQPAGDVDGVTADADVTVGEATEEAFSRDDLDLLDGATDDDDASEDAADADATETADDTDADATETADDTDAEARAEFVPEEPSGYELPQVAGREWTEGDQAAWASFSEEVAHKLGLPQGHLDEVGKWYSERLQAIEAGRAEADQQHIAETAAALRETWGEGSFKANLDAANATYRSLPKELRAEIKAARLPDGRLMANSPRFVELMLQASQAGGSSSREERIPSVDGRLAQIQKILSENPNRYWAESLDVEWAELEARKATGRKTAGSAPAVANAGERRIREIERVLRTDPDKYWSSGMDVEYGRLLAKRKSAA